jgi:transcription elongation GreA/GreB family factor
MQGPTETTDNLEGAIARMRAFLEERRYPQLEDVWMDVLENPEGVPPVVDQLIGVAECLVRDERERARGGSLLELLAPLLGEGIPERSTLRAYELLVQAFPEKKDHRASFAECFERVYPLASPERALYEASGFAASGARALERLNRLLEFREGAYVHHRSGWGVGRVLAVDPFLKQVRVDLEHKRDHRIAIDAVDSILEALPADSFLALRHDRVAELHRLRDEDPIRLVTLLHDAFGESLPLKDIKLHLIPAVIETSSWSRWWNRVKGILREAGTFRVGDRAPYLVERLETAVRYEDELAERFVRAEWEDARKMARQVARRAGSDLSTTWGKVRERLLKVCEGHEPTTAIEAALILLRGEAPADRDVARSVFARLSTHGLAAALQDLTGADDPRRAVEALPEMRPEDWREVAALLFGGKKDSLREAAWQLLESRAPEKAGALVQDLLRSPKSFPDAFTFLLSYFIAEPARPAFEPLRARGPRALLVLVLDLLDHLQHRAQREGRIALKDTIAKVQAILSEKQCTFFREGMSAMESPERHEVHARLVKNENLSPHAKGALLDALLDIEPGIELPPEKPIWERDEIFVTEAGLARRKEEFRELMEVKLPKNFQDIGRAAAFGDLSENAEYTSALEERDHLTKRAALMKAELDRAAVIQPELVERGVAGLGSRIRLRNLSTGEEVAYSVLGPWDGGPEDGVISYLSPLGRIFIGKREGETVEVQLPGGTEKYQLLEATSFFGEGA